MQPMAPHVDASFLKYFHIEHRIVFQEKTLDMWFWKGKKKERCPEKNIMRIEFILLEKNGFALLKEKKLVVV